MTRHAGVVAPVFSIPTTHSWGIGELLDVVPLADWVASAGFDRLMVLPLGTMSEGQSSPYFAVSTMAIDPIYIALAGVDDFIHSGGIGALSSEARLHLEAARASKFVSYDDVRRAKREALTRAFDHFVIDEWGRKTVRAASLAAYIARERWWLDDYALYEVLSEKTHQPSWRDWPAPLRDRDHAALDESRRRFSRDILQQQYWQWLAESQWQRARKTAAERGVTLFGDFVFGVKVESADVWARSAEFLLDVSMGAPPDAFSATGQDWSLPAYRWDTIAATDYAWLRQRARRAAALFDGLRVDHVVGLFRTYARPPNADPFFTPGDEQTQIEQGERILRILLDTRAVIVAEDLGTVPDFVRAWLTQLGIPGYKVLRWERDWSRQGEPFIDPANYPPLSLATTSTHDTDTLSAWWDSAPIDERAALVALPALTSRSDIRPETEWNDALRDALLDLVYRSAASELFLPLQDIFGWRDRINTPGTIDERNWTWRVPWPIDVWPTVDPVKRRAEFCRQLADTSGRSRAY